MNSFKIIYLKSATFYHALPYSLSLLYHLIQLGKSDQPTFSFNRSKVDLHESFLSHFLSNICNDRGSRVLGHSCMALPTKIHRVLSKKSRISRHTMKYIVIRTLQVIPAGNILLKSWAMSTNPPSSSSSLNPSNSIDAIVSCSGVPSKIRSRNLFPDLARVCSHTNSIIYTACWS